MFQVVFCATAATTVSGAMAERTKFSGDLIYSNVISAVVYPLFGSWAWGSLFNGVQVLGIEACFLWVFPVAFVLFKLIDKTVGLRVSAEEEMEGLDFAEHDGNAYPDFELSTYRGIGASSSGGGSGYGEEPLGVMSAKPLSSS